MSLVIYTGEGCTYCKAVKMHLESKEITFTEKDIHDDHEAMEFLISQGLRGIPQIFKDGVKIGDGTNYLKIS